MGTKHCCLGQCSSDSRKFKKDQKNKIFFIAFPKSHIDPAKCRRWIIACKRENSTRREIGCKLVIQEAIYKRRSGINYRSVASARMHVERTIGKIKGFRLLQKVIPKTFVPIISQLVFFVVMLVNFQEPLVNKQLIRIYIL